MKYFSSFYIKMICVCEVNMNKIWSLKTSLNNGFFVCSQIKNNFPLVTFEDSWDNKNVTGEIWKFTGVVLKHYII